MTREKFRLSGKTACYNQGKPKTPRWQSVGLKLIFNYYFAYKLAHIMQLPKCGKIAHLCNFTAGQPLGWQKCQSHITKHIQGTKTEPVRGQINFQHFLFKSQYSAGQEITENRRKSASEATDTIIIAASLLRLGNKVLEI